MEKRGDLRFWSKKSGVLHQYKVNKAFLVVATHCRTKNFAARGDISTYGIAKSALWVCLLHTACLEERSSYCCRPTLRKEL